VLALANAADTKNALTADGIAVGRRALTQPSQRCDG
jgi:hypothetical protein